MYVNPFSYRNPLMTTVYMSPCQSTAPYALCPRPDGIHILGYAPNLDSLPFSHENTNRLTELSWVCREDSVYQGGGQWAPRWSQVVSDACTAFPRACQGTLHSPGPRVRPLPGGASSLRPSRGVRRTCVRRCYVVEIRRAQDQAVLDADQQNHV